MPMLTEYQKKEMALAHRKLYIALCDEPGCEKLIPAGALFVVTKYRKINWEGKGEKPYTFNRRVPKYVRCADCQARKEGREPGESKVRVRSRRGKGKKLSVDEVSKLTFNPTIKKALIRLLKTTEDPLDTNTLIAKLKKKKALQSFKKQEFTATLRYLRKLRFIRRRQKLWALVS